ncbi:hypothetical protein [Pinibacter soli]|uniref:Uncharacterized protein n=1 Tax=Pinibacter soli TaxID=3044211 RepID=A0ABT6RC48_9BACT|nr:hypothetical protein [Pinibacter soli]MDI3320141.1 hypothetical protein [Pinibacter soli]
MYKIILLISFAFSTMMASAQSDFIVVKKRNNRTVKTFMPGSTITITTFQDYVLTGPVDTIRDDSIFVRMYNIRVMPTQFGTTIIDTAGSNVRGVNYKDIQKIDVGKKESFVFIKNGTLFMIGGLGYIALHLINGAYLHESPNGASIAIAGGVAAAGFIMNRIYHSRKKHGKLYKIEYIHMNDTNVQKARKGF